MGKPRLHLGPEAIDRLHKLHSTGCSRSTIADELGVSPNTVYYHLSGLCTRRRTRRFTAAEAEEVFVMLDSGAYTYHAISQLFGVSRSIIRSMALGHTYQDIRQSIK